MYAPHITMSYWHASTACEFVAQVVKPNRFLCCLPHTELRCTRNGLSQPSQQDALGKVTFPTWCLLLCALFSLIIHAYENLKGLILTADCLGPECLDELRRWSCGSCSTIAIILAADATAASLATVGAHGTRLATFQDLQAFH